MHFQVPIIDLFAGAGGLGEGFSALGRREGKPFFKIGLSVEKDQYAHSTLELRSFFRQFPYGEIPDCYYDFLRGLVSREELFANYPDQAAEAQREALHAELGAGQEFDDELDRKIEKIIHNHDNWVLIGGPPCQAYSLIGRSRTNREDDEKNYLYLEYLRIIARHRPAVFVMENVKGILSSKIQGNRIFDQILSDLRQPGVAFPRYRNVVPCRYRIFSLTKCIDPEKAEADLFEPQDFIVECERYGIPQARHRVILLGVRDDLAGVMPELLAPQPEIPIEAVISGLPRLRSGFSKEYDNPATWRQQLRESVNEPWIKSVRNEIDAGLAKKISGLLGKLRCPLDDRGNEYIGWTGTVREDLKWWYHDEKLNGVCNHSSRGHMLEDIYRYIYAACFAEYFGKSPKLHEFPSKLLPKHKNAKLGYFDDRFRVQVYKRPSTTIMSHISKDGHYFIHPDASQCRSLTVREAARLQTFPDNYFFCGNRTQQYVQVGNAVPPLFAYKVAGIVRGIFEKVQG